MIIAWLKGALAASFIAANTIIICAPLYLTALLRLALRGGWWAAVTRRMDSAIDLWVSANTAMLRALKVVELDVVPPATALRRDRWYLVICNHQTWADIILLQAVLRPMVPPLKFFTKQRLVWLPLAGPAMKMLGFPYVRRASTTGGNGFRAAANRDREATLAACAVFRNHPTSVLSFLEGTRFTAAKRATQKARFAHLLNPKTGGLSYVLGGLSTQQPQLLDVTIHYPDGAPGFWAFLCGRCRRAQLWVEVHDIPAAAQQAPATQRSKLGPFVEALWRAKDARLSAARRGQSPHIAPTVGTGNKARA